ncbi:hypothetical protein DFJ73DRAFT_846096 [Zopfochytrium polystomum]|nr:hypothetical protein DFJ73DRAFT_846096 [Zopfochytrium polystomum]
MSAACRRRCRPTTCRTTRRSPPPTPASPPAARPRARRTRSSSTATATPCAAARPTQTSSASASSPPPSPPSPPPALPATRARPCAATPRWSTTPPPTLTPACAAAVTGSSPPPTPRTRLPSTRSSIQQRPLLHSQPPPPPIPPRPHRLPPQPIPSSLRPPPPLRLDRPPAQGRRPIQIRRLQDPHHQGPAPPPRAAKQAKAATEPRRRPPRQILDPLDRRAYPPAPSLASPRASVSFSLPLRSFSSWCFFRAGGTRGRRRKRSSCLRSFSLRAPVAEVDQGQGRLDRRQPGQLAALRVQEHPCRFIQATTPIDGPRQPDFRLHTAPSSQSQTQTTASDFQHQIYQAGRLLSHQASSHSIHRLRQCSRAWSAWPAKQVL